MIKTDYPEVALLKREIKSVPSHFDFLVCYAFWSHFNLYIYPSEAGNKILELL